MFLVVTLVLDMLEGGIHHYDICKMAETPLKYQGDKF